MSELFEVFDDQYQQLYTLAVEHRSVDGYEEAVAWFDKNQSAPGVVEHLQALIAERSDFISSDREAAAFAFACAKLEIRPL